MILIVDCGSQTAHLIGRRLRELGVAFEYVQPEEALSEVHQKAAKGVIISGGPSSVYEAGAPRLEPAFFELDIPILGICYGWQLMADVMGGEVKNDRKEYGPEQLTMSSPVFKLPEETFQVFMSHGDSVIKAPAGFEVLGSTPQVVNAAVYNPERRFYGVQFHPEVDHTQHGLEMLKYFAHTVCGEALNPLKLDPEKIVAEIKEQVGSQQVIGAVSGGVDSTVAAFLIGKAIGQNFIPVYIESGLMREGTREHVQELFTRHIKADLVIVEARERFMAALKGLEDPEEKRKAIGKLYVELFQEEAIKHEQAAFLAQGTIYSDVIESKGTKNSSNIKSHHNVGGLPPEMKLKLLEPVRNYYKDEVRELGRLAGLPEEIVMQQPFPGPGYAIRVRGEVTEKRLAQVKVADEIVMEEIKKAGLYNKVFQSFAIMSGAYSTAVKGDARVFAEVVAIRAYESKDIMTSQWAHLSHDLLQKMSIRIVNEVPDVSRVVYDITTKPPATMEWE